MAHPLAAGRQRLRRSGTQTPVHPRRRLAATRTKPTESWFVSFPTARHSYRAKPFEVANSAFDDPLERPIKPWYAIRPPRAISVLLTGRRSTRWEGPDAIFKFENEKTIVLAGRPKNPFLGVQVRLRGAPVGTARNPVADGIDRAARTNVV